MGAALIVIGVVVFFAVIVLASSVRVLREYERGVMFRLGRLIGQKGPGLILLIPIIDKMVRVDLRTVTLSIPPQEVITRDNVPASVTAVCYFRVVNANDAIVQVENFLLATSQIAQTTLRAVLGRAELDTLLSERDRLNDELQRIIDEQTEPWGIKITTVEIKDVEIPQTMQRAMARQAEAERERRAKIIAAEGEFQASDKLSQAAEKIGKHPVAIQLRFLQTLIEVGSEHNSTTIFPVPIDLFQPFLEATRAQQSAAQRPSSRAALNPQLRIDPLTGLKVVLAPGRAKRPDSWLEHDAAGEGSRAARRAAGRAGARLPLLRRSRAADAARDLGAAARRRAARTRAAGSCARCRTSSPCWRRARDGDVPDPLDESRGEPELLRSAPATGDHEVIVHAPGALHDDGASWTRSSSTTALGGWRERLAAHSEAAWVHVMVNEGKTAGASLEHTHAQLYALPFVPVIAARERERFTAHNTHTRDRACSATCCRRRCACATA